MFRFAPKLERPKTEYSCFGFLNRDLQLTIFQYESNGEETINENTVENLSLTYFESLCHTNDIHHRLDFLVFHLRIFTS